MTCIENIFCFQISNYNYSLSRPPPPHVVWRGHLSRTLVFFCFDGVYIVVFELSFMQICYPIFWNFKKFQSISAKCCGSFKKFNAYSLRSFYFLLASIFVMGFYNLFNLKKTYAFVTSYNSAKASLYIKLRILLEPKFCLFYIHSWYRRQPLFEKLSFLTRTTNSSKLEVTWHKTCLFSSNLL